MVVTILMIFLRIKQSHFMHFKQYSGKSGPKFSTNWHGLKKVLTSTRPLLDDGGISEVPSRDRHRRSQARRGSQEVRSARAPIEG